MKLKTGGKNMNAKQTLEIIIDLFKSYLSELSLEARSDFIDGEITAYVETLEIIQGWKNAKNYNLNFNVAKKYGV